MVERQYRGKIVIGAKTEPVIAVASTGGVMVINAAFYLIGISQRSAAGQCQTKRDQNSCNFHRDPVRNPRKCTVRLASPMPVRYSAVPARRLVCHTGTFWTTPGGLRLTDSCSEPGTHLPDAKP